MKAFHIRFRSERAQRVVLLPSYHAQVRELRHLLAKQVSVRVEELRLHSSDDPSVALQDSDLVCAGARLVARRAPELRRAALVHRKPGPPDTVDACVFPRRVLRNASEM